MEPILVSGSFDDLRSPQVRLLQEAARLGPVHVLLWSDAVVERFQGRGPKFPQAERAYLVEAIRYVDRLTLCPDPFEPDALPNEPAIGWHCWLAQQCGSRELPTALLDKPAVAHGNLGRRFCQPHRRQG